MRFHQDVRNRPTRGVLSALLRLQGKAEVDEDLSAESIAGRSDGH